MTKTKQKLPSALHIQRFELKYAVSRTLGEKIIHDLLPWFKKDPHIDTFQDSYPVYTCYFDTPRLRYYWEKINGSLRRHKVRLRGYHYPLTPSNFVFAEIKKKYNNVITKDRAPLPLVAISTFLKSGTIAADARLYQSVFDRFFTMIQEDLLMPKTLVLYQRMAFLSHVSAYPTRITLDFDLHATQTTTVDDFLFGKEHAWHPLLPQMAILEIKYTNTMPAFLHDVILRYGLTCRAYSKYCTSVEKTMPSVLSPVL